MYETYNYSDREPVRVRASALPDFFDCPARAEARHLLGIRMPSGGKALLGTAIHAATATYDQSVLDQSGITVKEAAAAAVDAINKPEQEVKFDEGENPRDLERIAVSLHTMYCEEIAPQNDYAHVEIKCDNLVISDLALKLTGTTDRVHRTKDGALGIKDLKSGGTAVSASGEVPTKGHAYQLGVYELIAEHGSEINITAPAGIIGLQTGKTERGQRVAESKPIEGARDVLLGEPDSPGVLELVAKMIHTGTFPGNPRSMLCHERFCPIYQKCKWRK